MINNWRHNFAQGDFAFLIVQIATVPNTALIVTTDCGDARHIHPPFKQPVGERLSLAARALAYHQDIEYSGPMYNRIK